MFPYLFPWPIAGAVLEKLAYVAAALAAVLVASWMRGLAPRKGAGRLLAPVGVGAIALYAGVRIIRINLPFQTQPLPLHLYGVFIGLGFVLAIYLAAREGERSGFVR